ncbi:sugar phosphate isomerase/epimerase [Roseomonas genomospecies 6]|uniref:Sugar phosphate isomerase/epimerase n=1 Tax=Roseomonas genomospecies 6 TaxID=214106 RepID=A0A9W7TYZ7_9PROT|nr:sugar phosphate isomerase/epimerase family protein [Roseomonas genomospecies 6]KAA0680647.1 sugar phosphate isomerase/epimerase [Roseomonas genomospecies 6]
MNQRAIHSYTWIPKWSTKDGAYAIERAAAFGYGRIVVPIRDHDSIEPAAIASLCEKAGIRPIATSPLQIDNDISSTDPEVHRRGIERHCAALSLARDMGADRMGGILYSAFGKASKVPGEANFQAAADGLRIVAERAASQGMLLALEVVNRYETNLINTAEQAVRMIELIGAGNVRVHLDTFHMNIEEDDMLGALERAMPHLGYFEIDQNHRGRLTQGSIDFAPMLRRLKAANYQGLIGVEAFSSAVSHPDITAGVASWRNLFSHGDEVAREGQLLLDQHGF